MARIDYDTESDAVLIRAYAKGDDKAFETLYYRYRKPLYSYLNNLAGNCAEVDEVFAETWLRVIDKLPGYQDSGKFSAWLFRISRNIFIDRLRHNKPDKFTTINAENSPELVEVTMFSPDREVGKSDIAMAINTALSKLQKRESFY